jgi:hypothetical protein
MKSTGIAIAAALVLLVPPSTSRAQEQILILEITFEGNISDAVQDQMRESLHRGLNASSAHDVLSEGDSRESLGSSARRLMECGSNTECLIEAGEASGAGGGVVASVSEVGEIYMFTLDVYDLSTGEGVYFNDSDCALCTVAEAVEELESLATESSGNLPGGGGGRSTPSAVVVTVHTDPPEALIYLDGEEIGMGEAHLSLGSGSYGLTVEAVGFESYTGRIEIEAGDDDMSFDIELAEAGVASSGPRGGGSLDDLDTTAWGSILLGGGLIAVITGGVLLGLNGDTTCNEGETSACPDVFNTGAGGTALTIGGTAALTTGIIFLMWDSLAGESGARGDSTAGIGVGPDGGSVTWSQSF